jgi:hypothetical protein
MNHDLIQALRLRRLDVASALEAGMARCSDEGQLDFAVRHGRVLYSFNVADFCRIHGEWLAQGKPHAGILLAHQHQRYSVGTQLRGLQRLAAQFNAPDLHNRLEFLRDWV